MVKTTLLVFVCFFFMVTTAYGKTMYVTEVIEVMVRTGPDIAHKIIAMPKSGTPLEVLEVTDDWMRVRLPNNKEGWTLGRYLTSTPPMKETLVKLKDENSKLTLQKKTLTEENIRLAKECKALEEALSEQTRNAQALRGSYENLKKESKDFLTLKASYEQVTRDLAKKSEQLAKLEKDIKGLRYTQPLRWFLVGAGVILIGFVIGFISGRPRRRPSLLQ